MQNLRQFEFLTLEIKIPFLFDFCTDVLLTCPKIKNDCQIDVETYLLFASKRKEMTRKNTLTFKLSKLLLLSRTTRKHLRANQ